MKLMILFDGREYFVEPLSAGVQPDTIMEKHPGCMFLDDAASLEEAERKIQRDRDRNKPFSM
jgi:hypothetical protein